MDVQGKVAFITGGARGLGKLFAIALLDRGAKVSLADVNTQLGNVTERELKSKYGEDRAIFSKCDVTSIEDLRACYKRTLDTFGGLDIVINNAGINDENNFERQIAVNLTAVIRSSYMAAYHMNKENGGRGGLIINISSAAGFFASPYSLAYTGAKHGVVGFSRAMAMNVKDTNKFGLRIAALCPAFADTDMVNPNHALMKATRDADLTMPNREESAQASIRGVHELGIMNPHKVVEGMLELLNEPNSNGAALSISPIATRYFFPKKLTKKFLNKL